MHWHAPKKSLAIELFGTAVNVPLRFRVNIHKYQYQETKMCLPNVPYTFVLFKCLVFYFLLWSPVERYCCCQDPDGGNSCHSIRLYRPVLLTKYKQVHLLSLIWFLAYLESYLYIEEEIDQADVDNYEKMTPGFMDYDVSNIFRNIKNIIYSFISLWFSVIFWQLIYFLLLPFLMFREMGTTFMVSFKRDIGGFCLKNNSTAPGDEGKMAKEYCEVLVSCSNWFEWF